MKSPEQKELLKTTIKNLSDYIQDVDLSETTNFQQVYDSLTANKDTDEYIFDLMNSLESFEILLDDKEIILTENQLNNMLNELKLELSNS